MRNFLLVFVAVVVVAVSVSVSVAFPIGLVLCERAAHRDRAQHTNTRHAGQLCVDRPHVRLLSHSFIRSRSLASSSLANINTQAWRV